MPSTRKKNQGIDEAIKILRVIARNKEKHKAGELQTMLQACDRLMLIDEILEIDKLTALNSGAELTYTNNNPTGKSGIRKPPPSVIDKMMADMKARAAKAQTGGTNAAIESSNGEDGSGLRKEVDA